MIYKIINGFVSVFFIGFSLATFFTTKIYLVGSLEKYSGVLNGTIIGATNFAYKKVAYPLNLLENHKYDQ